MQPKIYTKTGDDGKSKTITGKRLPKSDLQFEVLGTIDELNATLGILHLSKKKSVRKLVIDIQNNIFNIGAYLAGSTITAKDRLWLLSVIESMEKNIDNIESKNKPLKYFILPGGSFESSYFHLARTICRRSERILVLIILKHKIPEGVLIQNFLNRLSDYLFVLARYYNNQGNKDIIWQKNESVT